jgi:hypothetical protein
MKINSGFKIRATVTPGIGIQFDPSQKLARREFETMAQNCFLAGTSSGMSDLNWKNYIETNIEVSFV